VTDKRLLWIVIPLSRRSNVPINFAEALYHAIPLGLLGPALQPVSYPVAKYQLWAGIYPARHQSTPVVLIRHSMAVELLFILGVEKNDIATSWE
jgi:hypothetical protein